MKLMLAGRRLAGGGSRPRTDFSIVGYYAPEDRPLK
jgi:hypothetical protein